MKKRYPPFYRKASRGIPGGLEAVKADLAAPDVPDIRRFGGINRAHIFPPPGRGVLVQIDAFSLFEGDQVSVYWASTAAPAASANVPPNQNSPLDIPVPADRLQPYPGNIEVWHTIYRPTSQETFISERLPVLVDFDVPGDPDPDQSTPYINENLAPIKGLDAGIPVGMPLTIRVPRWRYCSFGDKLIVSWGPVDLPFEVIEDSLGDTGPDVSITVPWAIIASVNGGLAFVTYHVEDSVTNHSLWAKSVEVDASTGGRHPMPTVLDTDDFGKLPIEVLNFGPVRVQVQYPAYASGDIVVLTFGGINRDGIALPDATYTFNWPDPAPIRHTFEVPYDKALALVGGEIRASYTVQTTTAPKPAPSAIAVTLVTGTPVKLSAPVVAEAVGGELDPAAPGLYVAVLVRADYPFFQPTDRITLHWRGESLDGQTIVSDQQFQLGSDAVNGEFRFSVARAKVVQVAGGKVTVSYEVQTPGNIIVSSEALSLAVKTGSGSVGLPPAIVEGASPDNTLDPADVGDSIVVHVPANAGFLPGDKIQVVWQGVGVGGSFTTLPEAANTAGVRFEVDKSVLGPNAGQRVTVYYILIRPGVDDEDSDKRHITVLEDSSEGDLPAPTVAEAPAGILDPITVPVTGVTVVVPARADLVSGDSVTVTFGNYTSSPPQAAQPGMTILVPPGEIARHLGKSISVFYTRWRGGVATNSDVMTLQVLAIEDNDAQVVPPSFVQANGTFVLDLNTFTGDATIQVTAWPLMAIGQRYWVKVGAWDIPTDPVTTVGDFTLTLNRDLLDTLPDGATLRIRLLVSFDGGGTTTAKPFDSSPYTARAALSLVLLAPEPELVGPDQKIDIGRIVDPRGLKVTVRRYEGMKAGQAIELNCVTDLGEQPQGRQTVDAIRDYEFFVSKPYLETLVDELGLASARFHYVVKATGIDETSPPKNVQFYRILAGETFETVTHGTLIQPGQSLTLSTMTIKCPADAAAIAIGKGTGVFPPYLTNTWMSAGSTGSGRMATDSPHGPRDDTIDTAVVVDASLRQTSAVAPSIDAEFIFKTPCSTVTLGVVSAWAHPTRIDFGAFDASGAPVGQAEALGKMQFVTLTAPPGKRITRLTMRGFGAVDNFTFTS
ncbi:hypothetical protein C8J98_10230 [Luteibacter sp. OK325]|uniref:hypothetical protein n=1 Tax=Luteibacter sp. OK325 TaxID=2135670 RepID=UPI000D340E26|nr:hypothetical protein [Luteibacter sp. OK325]PTR33845.1 hypothetical protein C8J98_10230 [Luteibacter sp. OK325]